MRLHKFSTRLKHIFTIFSYQNTSRPQKEKHQVVKGSLGGSLGSLHSIGSSDRVGGGGGARNMKSIWLPLVAIFFMTYLYRAGGHGPLGIPLGSATVAVPRCKGNEGCKEDVLVSPPFLSLKRSNKFNCSR